MSQPLAITGIHTNIGKTVTAAVLTQALYCDYWKPIQAGDLSHSDSIKLRRWVNNPHSQILPEAHSLNLAASPHHAAVVDGVDITLDSLVAPTPPSKPLLIETAGGVMSPVNATHTVADVLAHHQWPTLLVIQHYLGSIAHTLSAIESLRNRGVHIIGLIINGDDNTASEAFITQYTKLPIVTRIPSLNTLDAGTIAHVADTLRHNLPAELTPWMVKS